MTLSGVGAAITSSLFFLFFTGIESTVPPGKLTRTILVEIRSPAIAKKYNLLLFGDLKYNVGLGNFWGIYLHDKLKKFLKVLWYLAAYCRTGQNRISSSHYLVVLAFAWLVRSRQEAPSRQHMNPHAVLANQVFLFIILFGWYTWRVSFVSHKFICSVKPSKK